MFRASSSRAFATHLIHTALLCAVLLLLVPVAIDEHLRMQIRADLFNAFNHTNLSGLRTSLNDRFFGQLLSTRGARVIQMGATLSF